MSPAEVQSTLSGRLNQDVARVITIQAEEHTWRFTGQELGLRVDFAATADQAYAVGRQGNLLVDILTHLRLLVAPHNVEPVIRYDTGPLNQKLQHLADEFDQSPENAQLIIHSKAIVEVVPARRGRRLHLEATGAALDGALSSNDDRPVMAVTQEVIPAITEADIETARQQAENLLSGPLAFGFRTDTDVAEWRIEPQTLVTMFDIAETVDSQGKTQFALEFIQEEFTPYFEEFAKVVEIEPSEARLEIDPETGELTVLQHSRDGRNLDVEGAYQQLTTLQETLKAESSRPVALPLIITPAAVSSRDLDSLGIKELVSESTSYFKGSSQGRMHNIALSASKFHGVVIPPGEIFSFNQYLGEVTKENGFDESLIIFGNRTTVGIGGGVCQVSTTVFRTAFFGGFEIIERWAHGYRVSWYETKAGPGLDATIYTPDVDFRFRNDTNHHLLIQTETDLQAGTVTFRFYGTDPGREVIVSEPEVTNIVKHDPPLYEEDPTLPKGATKQVDWAKDGMDVTVTRLVKVGESVLHEDIISSHYKPWRAVYKVGTGEQVKQPSS
jgi:vancomycin resistance protein YoaR